MTKGNEIRIVAGAFCALMVTSFSAHGGHVTFGPDLGNSFSLAVGETSPEPFDLVAIHAVGDTFKLGSFTVTQGSPFGSHEPGWSTILDTGSVMA